MTDHGNNTITYTLHGPGSSLYAHRAGGKVWTKSASTNIVAEYDYTYDDADNMLTKTEPIKDVFGDNGHTGWTVQSGTWTASNGYLAKTNSGDGSIKQATTDPDGELRFDYRITDTNTTDFARIRLRSVAPDDYLYVVVRPTSIGLGKKISGVFTSLGSTTVSTTQDQWYTLRAEYDGADVTVWRSTEGELETQIVSTSSAQPLTNSLMNFGIYSGGTAGNDYEFDNIRILADDLENSTTFAYNTANELTSMTGPNGTTTFTYDDWGRQTAKTLNGVTDAYGYRYGSMLYGVDIGSDSVLDVVNEFGANHRRISQTVGGSLTRFKWASWTVINEEDDLGVLLAWYVPHLAMTPGDPNVSSYSYYFEDNRNSISRIVDSSRSEETIVEYDPYGGAYTFAGEASPRSFGGHRDPGIADMYAFAFRNYDSESGRWTVRDPSGYSDGLNLYSYVGANPIMNRDELGLLTERQCYIMRTLLECEKKHGTRECAMKYSNTWGNRQFYDDLNNKAFPTAKGDIDLDWWNDIRSQPMGNWFPDVWYIGGKIYWNFADPEGNPHWPYNDEKESCGTLPALRDGYDTYADLFPSDFMAACPPSDQYHWDGEGGADRRQFDDRRTRRGRRGCRGSQGPSANGGAW